MTKDDTKKGKMSVIKPKDNDIDAFFGIDNKEKKETWKVSLEFTKDEQEIIKKGLSALPREKKAMRDYQKEAILQKADKDIEKGKILEKTLEELNKE